MAVKPFSILAHSVKSAEDLFRRSKSWWVTRKYNGHGMIYDGGWTQGKPATNFPWYWKGKDKGVVSTGLWTIGRDGKSKVVNAPAEWLKKLPRGIPLQGELWHEDNLQFIKKLKKGTPNPAMWKNAKFVVYNIKPHCTFPEVDISDLPRNHIEYFYNTPFRSRLVQLTECLKNDDWKHGKKSVLIYPDNDLFTFNSVEELNHCLTIARKTMAELEWEGMMWQNLESHYECKRSYSLLKDKSKYDAEAVITGYTEGKEGKTGDRLGCIGALQAELTWGEEVESFHGGEASHVGQSVSFRIAGINKEEQYWDDKEERFPVGTLIKFTFSNVSIHGVPQSCNLCRS